MSLPTTASGRFAPALTPPYYAVVFASQRRPDGAATPQVDGPSYAQTADRMVELAQQQPGFLGVESARDASGFGITVSYWQDETSIANWKRHGEHLQAQRKGHQTWYEHFELRVAKVERAKSM
jgi:heme-degrading monooxygenase HmoA